MLHKAKFHRADDFDVVSDLIILHFFAKKSLRAAHFLRVKVVKAHICGVCDPVIIHALPQHFVDVAKLRVLVGDGVCDVEIFAILGLREA